MVKTQPESTRPQNFSHTYSRLLALTRMFIPELAMATKQGIDRGGYGSINPRPIIEHETQTLTLTFETPEWHPTGSFYLGEAIDTPIMGDAKENNDVAVLDEFQWSYTIEQVEYGNRYSGNLYDGKVNIGLRHPDNIPEDETYEAIFDKGTLGYDERSTFIRENTTRNVLKWDVNVPPATGEGTYEAEIPDNANGSFASGAHIIGTQRTVPLHQKIWPFGKIQFVGGIDFNAAASSDLAEEPTVYDLTFRLVLTWHYEPIRNWDLNRVVFQNQQYLTTY